MQGRSVCQSLIKQLTHWLSPLPFFGPMQEVAKINPRKCLVVIVVFRWTLMVEAYARVRDCTVTHLLPQPHRTVTRAWLR